MKRRSSLSNSSRRCRCGTFRISPFGRGLNLLALFLLLGTSSSFGRKYPFSDSDHNSLLTYFADKAHVAPRLSHTNVQALNYLLRLEIFVSEDGELRAAHLILGYKPLSRVFQDIGQSIRAGSSRLARIDVSKPGFLAQRDLPPVTLPIP